MKAVQGAVRPDGIKPVQTGFLPRAPSWLVIWSNGASLSSLWAESVLVLFGFQTERSYFATVKLLYTIGYSASLVLLAVAVFILLLFR